MVTRMVFAYMLVTPFVVQAGWLDDLVACYTKAGAFDRTEALQVIDGYREKDEKKHHELEEAAKRNDTLGLWGTVRGGSYQAELALLRNQIEYYKKVARTIAEFHENKKQEESFIGALKKLSRYRKQLEELRSDYRKSSGIFDKASIGTAIAWKEGRLAGYKAYVKNRLF